jgi:hypothetical protein
MDKDIFYLNILFSFPILKLELNGKDAELNIEIPKLDKNIKIEGRIFFE